MAFTMRSVQGIDIVWRCVGGDLVLERVLSGHGERKFSSLFKR